MNKKSLYFKHLLGLEYLNKEQIENILDTAVEFKDVSLRSIKKVPALRGKTVVNLFFENSTRTRISFEVAAKRLSADVINFSVSTSSVKKGESLIDTAVTIESIASDAIVIRHSSPGSPKLLADNIKSHIINAGDGPHEHPTQGLLDMFTVKEKLGKFKDLKIVIIGDIIHSRVARSNMWGLSKLGAKVVLCGPPTLVPEHFAQLENVDIEYNLDKAIKDADAVNILRIQLERQKKGYFPSLREYTMQYCVTEERLQNAKPNCLVMHPGPMNRGREIAPRVADGIQSVINEQVTNGVATRMSVLYLMLSGV